MFLYETLQRHQYSFYYHSRTSVKSAKQQQEQQINLILARIHNMCPPPKNHVFYTLSIYISNLCRYVYRRPYMYLFICNKTKSSSACFVVQQFCPSRRRYIRLILAPFVYNSPRTQICTKNNNTPKTK